VSHTQDMQRPFIHPTLDAISLEGVLHALADPVRLVIVCTLERGDCPLNCSKAAPSGLAKSTQSHHYHVLREAGLIRSERRGTEVINTLRMGELDTKFPGLVAAILTSARRAHHEASAAQVAVDGVDHHG
jgi:DNA-binding transcriptional ArsR family regulator